jgi:AAA+ ATPase superfamily predicted ATPase
MNSPFNYGKIAEGSAFCSRHDDVSRLHSNLANKTNTAIVAPRKWGKSSLVKQVVQQLSTYSFYRFCFIDLFKVRNEEEFYQHLANEVIKSITPNMEKRIRLAKDFLTDLSPKLGLSIGHDDLNLQFDYAQEFSANVLQLGNDIGSKEGLVIYLFIDNFQNIEHFDQSESFLRKLASAWQGQPNMVFCLYGSKKKYLEKLFTDSQSPFYKFCTPFFLEKMTIHELSSYVCSRFRETNKSIPLNLANRIVTLMDRHPFYVQQLAHIVWERTSGTVNDKAIDEAASDLVGRNLLLFQRDFENLSNIQVNFLKAIIDGVQEGFTSGKVIREYRLNSSPATLRAIEALEKKEILERYNSRFEFIDPAFKLWLKHIGLSRNTTI